MTWPVFITLSITFALSHVLFFLLGARSGVSYSRYIISKIEKDYAKKIASVAGQLEKYADHIESNYMDAEESSVIRSCSNMLRGLVKDDE